MRNYLQSAILFCFLGLFFLGCSSADNSNNQKADAGSQDNFDIDDENNHDDVRGDTNNPNADIDEIEDISEAENIDAEEPNSGLQYVQLRALEGMVNLSWDLPEDHIMTDIRITASPAELMWGDAERHIEATATSYLFDKLVNDVKYTFEIQAYADDEEVGEAFIRHAIPFSRSLLAVERGPATGAMTNIIDSVTKRTALGWESLIQPNATAYRWSPDGTKLVTYHHQPGEPGHGCAIFERATRERIPLEFSLEFNELCAIFDLSWPPDNRRFAFTRFQVDDGMPLSDLFVYSVYNMMTAAVEPGWPDLLEYLPSSGFLTLDWSPDGERLAIPLIYHGGNTMRLIIINTSTKEIEPDWIEYPISSFGKSFRSLRWSPDSKRLAIGYSSGIYTPELNREAKYHILNAETKEVETNWPEISLAHVSDIRWSPDGELLILIHKLGQNPSLQVINTRTHETEPGWPSDWPRIQDVAWSHDSRFLAISSAESPYLLVFDRDSKEIQDGWTPLPYPSEELSWSPQHDPPSAPTEVELTRTGDSAALSWVPPEDANILDYRITLEPADQVNGPADYLIFDADSTEYLVEGLSPEVDYTVSLSAITVFGVGEPAIISLTD